MKQPTGMDLSQRQRQMVELFEEAFGDLASSSPDAFRTKFRKMAASPFAFYRGSACLFYADIARTDDGFGDHETERVWIQGDMHAENFGTYMNSEGVIVFDVNDFDEAYIGPFTWDVKRLAASLALLGIAKAFDDDEILEIISTFASAYADQVQKFALTPGLTRDFALTRSSCEGPLLDVLLDACTQSRSGLLDSCSTVEQHHRRFLLDQNTRPVSTAEREAVEEALERYFDTLPKQHQHRLGGAVIKDVVAKAGFGIGSAGLTSYNLLLEGPTQAFEDDVLLYMKRAQRTVIGKFVADPSIASYFEHDGHRTVVSQRALQAHADPWLGYSTLDGMGQLIARVSPYTKDLDWNRLTDVQDILRVVDQLGRALAKTHCVSDMESDHTLVPFSTDEAINRVLEGNLGRFVAMAQSFAMDYSATVIEDHRQFVDAFRNHHFFGL